MGPKINNNQPLHDEMSKKANPLDEEDFLVLEYPDYYPNGNKKVKVKNLGEKFASINAFFFDYVKEYHIPCAFIRSQDERSLKFLKHERFPFSVKILNVLDKRTSKIFSLKEGEPLPLPVIEFHYGNGKESLISESHLIAFDFCTSEELKIMARICSKVNAVLKSFFERRGNLLAETSLYFGKCDEKIYIVDDFTPQSLKVVPVNLNGGKDVDPYKFGTSVEIRHYTDHLYNLMSA